MFAERLQAIAARLDGLRLVALLAEDGIPVEVHDPGSGVDVEALAAEMVTQLRSISRQHGELAMGGVKQLSIATGQRTILAGSLAAGHYLVLVLDEGAMIGRARFELRRAPLAFDSDLE